MVFNDKNDDIKYHILNYFNINIDTKLLDKLNYASAIRELFSKYISGLRHDTDIDLNGNVRLYISIRDLWYKHIKNSHEFEKEINNI